MQLDRSARLANSGTQEALRAPTVRDHSPREYYEGGGGDEGRRSLSHNRYGRICAVNKDGTLRTRAKNTHLKDYNSGAL
eukprot:7306027-Pyramimonas_sp.AAC.1